MSELPEPVAFRGVDCRVDGDEGGIRVKLAGEIDISVAEDLGHWLIESSKAQEGLALDLVDVGFMDSTGLHMLITLKKELEENGRELHLAAVSEAVEELLKASGLATFFD